MAEQEFGVLNDTQKRSLRHLELEAQAKLNKEYGTGYPRYEGGNGLWFYHNGNHGSYVGNGTERGCEAAGLSPDIRMVGRYGGLEHDEIQGPGHEARSAALVEETLRREGMPKWAAEMASLAIAGTEVVIEHGVITAQKASQQEYPSPEAEKMALAMADADMGVLYSPWGPLYMHDYYRETVGEAEPEMGEHFYGFKTGQIRMLDKYKYPSPHGEKIFATHRTDVMTYHLKLQGRVQSGEISTWTQLRASDLVFAQSLM